LTGLIGQHAQGVAGIEVGTELARVLAQLPLGEGGWPQIDAALAQVAQFDGQNLVEAVS